MTIDEIIKKEEQKIKTLLFSTREHAFALLTAEEKSAVADSVHEILQQNYLTLVNAIGHMAKLTKVDTRACGDIVALTSVVFSAVSERTHPSEAPRQVPSYTNKLTDEAHHAHKGDIEKAESNASFAKLAETVIEMATGPKSVTITTDDIAKALQKNERSQPLDVKWERVPDKFNWAAKDRNGRIFLYTTKPKVYDNQWRTNDGSCERLDREWLNSETNVYWENSRTQRDSRTQRGQHY